MVNRAPGTPTGQYFYDGYLKRGFSPVQSAVLTGNVKQESGFNPTAYNPNEDAAGALQWRLDRLAGLAQYASATKRSPSDPDVQMDWTVKEMQGPEAKNAAAFLSSNDPQAANTALKKFIRYGDNSQGARLQNAMAFLPGATNGSGGGSAAPAPSGANPPPAATTVAQNASPASGGGSASSRAAFLSHWGVDPTQDGSTPATASTPAPMASGAPANDRAAFLSSWGVDPTTAPVAPGSQQSAPVANPSSVMATGPGTFDGQPVTPGASGNNAMAKGKASAMPPMSPADAAQPSSMPWLDPVSAFANAAVDAIPVAGPQLTRFANWADAGMNNLMGYPTEQPEDRAAINAATAAKNPLVSTAGTVAGTVAPFLFVGPETIAGKALGMAGDMGAKTAVGNVLMRTLAGGVSGAAISGADTAARGGSLDDIKQNAVTGGAVGGVTAPIGRAVGDLVGRGWNAFVGKSAAQNLADALKADQINPTNANQLVQRMGPGAAVADLGPNTQGLAGALASLPGEAKTTVVNNLVRRASEAPNRLTADVNGTLGQGQPIGALTDSVTAAQKAAADPLYAAVRHTPVQITPALRALQGTPLGKQAFQKAAEMMANDGQRGAGTTVGFMDYAKQALDDITSSAQRSGENNAARQSTGMANTITNEVNAQVPGYAAARSAFAGPAKVKDAITAGQSAFSSAVAPEDLRAQWSAYSPSERDGYLAGAQSAVQRLVGNAKNDAAGVQNAFRSGNAKEKLAILVGQPHADQISAALDREADFSRTSNVATGNSQTAARLAGQKAVNPDLAAIPGQAAQPTLLGIFGGAFGAARKALTSVYRNGQNVSLANMLTSGPLSPADARAVTAAAGARNSVLPAAALALGSKNTDVAPMPDNPFVRWASPTPPNNVLVAPHQTPDMTLPLGPGGQRPPLRIVVRGASPIPAYQ
jgi:hypothetical protein